MRGGLSEAHRARATAVIWGETRGNFIYFVARARKQRTLLSCKRRGTHSIVRVCKVAPVRKRFCPFYHGPFYQTSRTDVHACKMDAMTYRMHFSVTSEAVTAVKIKRDETYKGKGNLCFLVTNIQIILSEHTSRRCKLEYVSRWRLMFLIIKRMIKKNFFLNFNVKYFTGDLITDYYKGERSNFYIHRLNQWFYRISSKVFFKIINSLELYFYRDFQNKLSEKFVFNYNITKSLNIETLRNSN